MTKETNETDSNNKIIRQIVLERLRHTSPNFKVALGSEGKFFHRDDLIAEISKNTEVGNRIVEIQKKYLQSLKNGIVA